MAINYLQRVQARNQANQPSDVERGLQAGEAVGKLLGSLGTAIKGAQMDAAANKLMNTQNAPRAALVSPGSQTVTTPGGSSQVGGSPGFEDPDPDPIPAQPSLGINTDTPPETYDLSNDIAATRAQNQITGPTTRTVANTIAPGVSTAGTTPFTGGVEGMKLQQQFQQNQLADQLRRAQVADQLAESQGTGKYALDTATKQANLARIQQETYNLRNPKQPVDKNPPPVDIASEPVIDQNQLSKHIDGIYGNGSAAKLASAVNEPETIPDPNNPNNTIPNPNAPVINGDTVTIQTGPNKSINMPVNEAATYVKQANVLRIKQGLPPLRVPGENYTGPNLVGSSAGNPFIAQTNLDVYSRAPGTWIRLPNGKVAQVPARK